jgi:hypothetical protein
MSGETLKEILTRNIMYGDDFHGYAPDKPWLSHLFTTKGKSLIWVMGDMAVADDPNLNEFLCDSWGKIAKDIFLESLGDWGYFFEINNDNIKITNKPNSIYQPNIDKHLWIENRFNQADKPIFPHYPKLTFSGKMGEYFIGSTKKAEGCILSSDCGDYHWVINPQIFNYLNSVSGPESELYGGGGEVFFYNKDRLIGITTNNKGPICPHEIREIGVA